jgi:hypothetical protein
MNQVCCLDNYFKKTQENFIWMIFPIIIIIIIIIIIDIRWRTREYMH